jgi:hypothetical protein
VAERVLAWPAKQADALCLSTRFPPPGEEGRKKKKEKSTSLSPFPSYVHETGAGGAFLPSLIARPSSQANNMEGNE